MLKKLIVPSKKKPDMTAIAISDTTIVGVVNKSATYVKKVIVDEDYECIKDWLSCPNVNLNLVDLHSINAQYPDLLNLLNIDINNIRVYYDTDMEKPTVTRAARIKVDGDMIELCEIKLGYWRKYYDKNESIKDLFIGKRTYYDKATGLKKLKDNGNTDFRTMIMCVPDKQDLAIAKIKEIAKQDNKIHIDWL